MKSLPFKAAKSAFDIRKVISGDVHLWMAIISIVRLVLHWTGESVIEGGSEALTVWIVMAVWGVLGVIKDIRKGGTPSSSVSIVLLLALLSLSAGCSQAKLATMKKGLFKCGMTCLRSCLAEQAVRHAVDLNDPVSTKEVIEDD